MFNPLKLLTRNRFGKYTQSERAAIYERIAGQHFTNAQHVYELAHGLRPESLDDTRVLETLKNEGIIHRTRN